MKKISVFLVLITLLSSCTPLNAAATQPETLTVFAAASLTESFTELKQIFESNHPDVRVVFNFAGAQQLQEQIAQGAQADVFASASHKYMDLAIESGSVSGNSVRLFVTNRLVIIYPNGNPAGLQKLEDLANPGLKLILADEAVPVGKYSLEFMDKTGNSAYKNAVLANVVSYEDNVKSVLTKVALGEADAGIVYVSDITPEASTQVGKIEIPDPFNVIAEYPISPITESRHPELAADFINLVLSPEGQAVLQAHNFIPVD